MLRPTGFPNLEENGGNHDSGGTDKDLKEVVKTSFKTWKRLTRLSFS